MKTGGRIFLVDDDELIVTMTARSLKKKGYETQVQTSAKDIFNKIVAWHPDLILLDIHLDENTNGLDILAEIKREKLATPVVMLTSDDSAESAIKAMKLGAVDYLTKPFNIDEVHIVVANILENSRLKDEVEYLRKTGLSCVETQIVGESPAMKSILQKVEMFAKAKTGSLLITGESGTGKEVLARYFHTIYHGEISNDAEYTPFIAINCTALPENLIESELFGHTRGAFTDAKTDKKGVFELADGGTLLLDEFGDMRLDMQSKFLRVLETRTVRRLGGKIDLHFNAAIIAATNTELKKAVEVGEFREDLFYRLNTFAVHLPPLRDRIEDIPYLAQHFLDFFAHQYFKKDLKGFSPEAAKALTQARWPGNIRELRNVIERCVVLQSGDLITMEHLPVELTGTTLVERRKNTQIILPENGLSLDELEKDLVHQAMVRANYNKTKAAKLLNITYDTLRYQVKKHDLDR
ncbi:MAG: sigma-54 dependent transcriptional regulator [Proteobacteria bacterium]|nr:sigma-54 dependent transcriptional regulator [Pseudomonadota bacterium]MBU1641019.1 sigma-54 dependent transcriptional regulator [Pseudomonadota bacterium]